jgi:hypothetical protein
MSTPVSSSSPPLTSSVQPDPTLDEDGQICRDLSASTPNSAAASTPNSSAGPSASTAPNGSASPAPKPPAVVQLMSAVPQPPSVLPPPSPSKPLDGAANNAQRTTTRSGVSGYADYGVTGTGDGVFAGAAALKGRDSKTGLEVEVFGASAQAGLQSEEQLTMARVGLSGKNGAISAEAFTARRGAGVRNDDGSVGLNAGAIATAVGFEGTLGGGPDSVTVGAGIGVGIAGSVGARDIDDDGILEYCAKLSVGFITLGVCAEN